MPRFLKTTWIVAGLTALTAARLGAQTKDTIRLTMDAAVERALAAGEEMRAARAQVRDANGTVIEAMSAALPHITGSVGYTRQFASLYEDFGVDTVIAPIFQDSPFGAANAWNVELRASQLLFASGKVGAALKGARAYRESANYTAEQTASDIAYSVKQAYLQASMTGELVVIARASLAQAREHLTQVQRFQLAGTRAEYDLLRAQVDVANQEPLVVEAENAQALAILQLRRLINVPADQPLELVTALVSADGTLPVANLDSIGPAVRASVAAANADVLVQEQAVKVARADRYPTLSASATLANQAFPDSPSPFTADFKRNWNAEIRLAVPLFLGRKTVGAVERAQATLERTRAQRDQTAEMVGLEIEKARAELQRAQSLVAARRVTVRQALRAHHLASVRYTNGMSTQLEVSDARLIAQQAAADEVQATRDYRLALAQLEHALGRPVPVQVKTLDQIANINQQTEGKQP